jgi:hypothetical protein
LIASRNGYKSERKLTHTKENDMTTTREFKAHAQIQKSSRGETVTFQPDDLLCDGCWDLRETAYVNAMIGGGRAYSRVVKANGEEHGMRAEIEKDN